MPGRDKYSRALVGVIYNSERMLSPSDWLNSLDNLLGYLTVYWDGMLMLTGDINIDILRPSDHLTKRYQGIYWICLSLHRLWNGPHVLRGPPKP